MKVLRQTARFRIDPALIIWIVLGIWLAIVFSLTQDRYFDRDELESVHTAWKISQGERIYVDFFQHHHPFFYYLLTPAIDFIGASTAVFTVLRLGMYLFLLAILFVVYRIGERLHDRETAVIGLLLLATTPIFMSKAIEIRPDVVQTLFGLSAVLFLLKFFDTGSRKDLVLSALSLAISFLFLQKSVFLALLIAAVFGSSVYRKQTGARELVIYGIVFAIPQAIYLAYLLHTDTLSSYWTFNWLLNMVSLNRFSAFRYLDDSFLLNTLLWGFFVWGCISLSKTPNLKRLRLLAIGMLVSVFLVRSPYRQYFMMAFPLMAIIAAHAIRSSFAAGNRRNAVIALSVLLPCAVFLNDTRDTNTRQLQKIDYVLSLTGEDDYVYDDEIAFNVFRRDLDFFWYSLRPDGLLATYRTLYPYEYDICHLIERFEPKIIADNLLEDSAIGTIEDEYHPSALYPNLFIRNVTYRWSEGPLADQPYLDREYLRLQ